MIIPLFSIVASAPEVAPVLLLLLTMPPKLLVWLSSGFCFVEDFLLATEMKKKGQLVHWVLVFQANILAAS
jgi:hypothetical protein